MVKVYSTTCGNVEVDGFVLDRVKGLRDSEFVTSLNEADVVFYLWTWHPEYVCDPETVKAVLLSGKPVVVFDYLECENDYQIILTNSFNWPGKLSAYKPCADLAPAVKLYFKREFSKRTVPTTAFPLKVIDFTSTFSPHEPDTEEAFNARPIDIFYSYGFSSCDRPLLHAELVKRKLCNGLCTSLEDLDYAFAKGHKRQTAILYTPHYRRIPLDTLMAYQSKAKLSLCLRGASWKCFRHAEASFNSVMAMQESPVDFTYPWTDGVNCVVLPNLTRPNRNPPHWIDVKAAVDKIEQALHANLYRIYVAGCVQARRYINSVYMEEHVVPALREAGIWS
jgi:hypothetical protein